MRQITKKKTVISEHTDAFSRVQSKALAEPLVEGSVPPGHRGGRLSGSVCRCQLSKPG